MEDRIPGGLQYHHRIYCKKGELVCFGNDFIAGM